MTVFTFGLPLMGMDMMSTAMKPQQTYQPFIALMKTVEQPIMEILKRMGFTMVIQSSGATPVSQ